MPAPRNVHGHDTLPCQRTRLDVRRAAATIRSEQDLRRAHALVPRQRSSHSTVTCAFSRETSTDHAWTCMPLWFTRPRSSRDSSSPAVTTHRDPSAPATCGAPPLESPQREQREHQSSGSQTGSFRRQSKDLASSPSTGRRGRHAKHHLAFAQNRSRPDESHAGENAQRQTHEVKLRKMSWHFFPPCPACRWPESSRARRPDTPAHSSVFPRPFLVVAVGADKNACDQRAGQAYRDIAPGEGEWH